MTVARRLTAIEAAMSPTDVVCRWLDEAHAFDELDAYAVWLMDQPDEGHVPDRLLREAAEGVRARRARGKAAAADDAIRQAHRETLFRSELVLRINVVIHEAIERETLIRMVLSLRLAMLLDDQPVRHVGPGPGRLLLLMDGRAQHLRQLEAARITVESEYLAGHGALFPAELRRWDEARHATDQLVAIHARLGQLDGWLPEPEPASPLDDDAVIGSLRDDLVEPARVRALEKLDEGRRAFAVASRWLRPKLEGSGRDLPQP